VNCEFCGTTVLPGAKLCAACRSALKRARNDPASVLQPLVKRASDTLQRRRQRKAAAQGDKAPAAAAVIPPPVGAHRGVTPAVVAAIAAALCVIGYVILQHRDDGARADSPMTLAAPAAAAAAASAVPDAGPGPRPSRAPLSPIVSPAAPEIAAGPQPANKAKRARPKELPALLPLPLEAPAVIAQPLPAPRVAVKSAPPDRRTQLRSAFDHCASTDVLGQAFCEQRARIELCDGLWGTVPQCPAQRDYGG
jgi:hypothetical protein